jgi:aldehyde dehydrogenase (NAD+)
LKTYRHFIAGQYVDPVAGKWIESMDPYRGEAWAKIPQGCAHDVDRAVTAASPAMQGPWSKMTPSAGGKLMVKLADLVAANVDRLAEIEVRDNGKLLAEMRGQVLMKHSGIGSESGIEAIREYLETKSVWISMAEGSLANPFVLR